MRPVPESHHKRVILILLAAGVVTGFLVWFDNMESPDQVLSATVAIKRAQPGLFSDDPIFGRIGLWQFHSRSFQFLLDVLRTKEEIEDYQPMRLLAGPVSFVYLLGMYLLMYRQCRSWSIAAFVAILSLRVTFTVGRAFWGIGPLGSIEPQGIYIAVIPLLLEIYFRLCRSWKVLLVFALIAMLGDLSLVVAMNLGVLLAVGHLACRKLTWRMVVQSAVGLVMVGAAGVWLLGVGARALYGGEGFTSWGYGLNVLWYALCRSHDGFTAKIAAEALNLADHNVLYPVLLESLFNLGWGVAVLLIPAILSLLRLERFRVHGLRFWTVFAAGALVLALGAQGLSQLIGYRLNDRPWIIDFTQASVLLGLPLYAMVSQALTSLFRLFRTHRLMLRWACAIVMFVWMVPSDNFRPVRHWAYGASAIFTKEPDQPRRAAQLRDRTKQQAELKRIARWAKENIDNDAMFLSDDIKLRFISRRAILVSPETIRLTYYLLPGHLEAQTRRMEQLSRLIHPPTGRADPQAIARFVEEQKQHKMFSKVSGWYVVLDAAVVPDQPGIMQQVFHDDWGTYFKVYFIN